MHSASTAQTSVSRILIVILCMGSLAYKLFPFCILSICENIIKMPLHASAWHMSS